MSSCEKNSTILLSSSCEILGYLEDRVLRDRAKSWMSPLVLMSSTWDFNSSLGFNFNGFESVDVVGSDVRKLRRRPVISLSRSNLSLGYLALNLADLSLPDGGSREAKLALKVSRSLVSLSLSAWSWTARSSLAPVSDLSLAAKLSALSWAILFSNSTSRAADALSLASRFWIFFLSQQFDFLFR